MCAVPLDFGDGFAAAFADCRVTLVLADVDRVVPAALALLAFGLLNCDFEAGDCVGAVNRSTSQALFA